MTSTPGPLFSVITPVYDPPADVLTQTISSVRDQTFTDWELILVDDGSRSEGVQSVLRAAADSDERIRVLIRSDNGGIVAASNDAADAAVGAFLVPLDHDDLLTPHALERVARAIVESPEADYLYSDEDKFDPDRGFCDAFAKPGFAPERLRGQAYPTHLSVLRRSLVMTVGAYRAGFDGAQDYDLILRVTERARQIVHIPEILYHWRVVPGSTAGDPHAKPYAWEAGRRAIQEQLNRLAINGRAHLGARPGFYRVEYYVDPTRRVSLVVSTSGRRELAWGQRVNLAVSAAESILARAGVTVGEVVVVGGAAALEAFAADWESAIPLVAVPVDPAEDTGPAAWNAGVAASSGEFVVLFEGGMEAVSARFLENLVGPLLQPDVGMVGPQIVHADGRRCDAGLLVRGDGWAPLLPEGSPDDPGPFGVALLTREVSALHHGCLALRRRNFQMVGGFSELFGRAESAVDLALKLREHHLRLIWTPHAAMVSLQTADSPPLVASPGLRERWTIPPDDPWLPGVGLPGAAEAGR